MKTLFLVLVIFFSHTSFAKQHGPKSNSKAKGKCEAQNEFGGNSRDIASISSASINSSGNGPSNGPGNQLEQYLRGKLRTSNLAKGLPQEISSCASSNENASVEFMRGLSYIESTWDINCNNPDDANGKPSTGLYQMTAGDKASGKSCFSNQEETKDPVKNIDCAIGTITEGRGEKYFGPWKRKDEKFKKILDIVKNKACSGQSASSLINWPEELKGSGGSNETVVASKSGNSST